MYSDAHQHYTGLLDNIDVRIEHHSPLGPFDEAQVWNALPHLSKERLAETLRSVSSYPATWIAAPNVMMRGTYQVLRIERYSRGKFNVRRVHSARYYPKRCRADLFALEAMRYADRHWGGRLRWFPVESCIPYALLDPTMPTGEGRLRCRRLVTVALNRKISDIEDQVRRDGSETYEELVDDAIKGVALSLAAQSEIHASSRDSMQVVNPVCARCGSALGDLRCTGCQTEYSNGSLRHRSPYGLPNKVRKTLIAGGYEFEEDPLPLPIGSSVHAL